MHLPPRGSRTSPLRAWSIPSLVAIVMRAKGPEQSATSIVPVSPLRLAFDEFEVGVDHVVDERLERGAVHPAELLPRLGRIADEELDLGRAEIAGIDHDAGLSVLLVDAALLDAAAGPFDLAPDARKRLLDELAHRVH